VGQEPASSAEIATEGRYGSVCGSFSARLLRKRPDPAFWAVGWMRFGTAGITLDRPLLDELAPPLAAPTSPGSCPRWKSPGLPAAQRQPTPTLREAWPSSWSGLAGAGACPVSSWRNLHWADDISLRFARVSSAAASLGWRALLLADGAGRGAGRFAGNTTTACRSCSVRTRLSTCPYFLLFPGQKLSRS
jgi:hypothetical protein